MSERLSYRNRAGRFEGLSDLEWKLFEDGMTKVREKRERGMPHAPFRHVLNTLMYVLITGCRWCDVPNGEIWASKSLAHRWLCAKGKLMERFNYCKHF